MIIPITFALLYPIVLSVASDFNDSARKHYGMSYHVNCGNYLKSFTCMSACKSIGFEVFRMDKKCKCTCHELKTTTILPFFKWQTNGTTPKVPRTVSIKLYHIVGTLSPQPVSETEESITNATLPTCDWGNFTMPTVPDFNKTQSGDKKDGTSEKPESETVVEEEKVNEGKAQEADENAAEGEVKAENEKTNTAEE